MRIIENECVDCGLPCIDTCPYKNVTRYYCDKCGEESTLYHYDNYEICEQCLLAEFEIVEGSN